MSFSSGDQTWLKLVRKWKGKKFFKVRESQGISLLVRKNLYLWNKSGENEILRAHAY